MIGSQKQRMILTHNFTLGAWTEYKICTHEGIVPKEPTAGVRGNLARAYLYMSFQYRIPIHNKLENKLRFWHFEDPPDKAENSRNSLIELIQGNRNPFIDSPEIVKNVKDF